MSQPYASLKNTLLWVGDRDIEMDKVLASPVTDLGSGGEKQELYVSNIPRTYMTP